MFHFFKRREPAGNRIVSLILRRQIPIRHGEAAGSWLGGLPMMPEGIDWPRDAGGAPLHFLAQISCAALPPKLWNGLGPRKGWLLLFVNTLGFEGVAEGGTPCVLHIDRLGPERTPPEDMPTLRHAMSDGIGFSEPHIRPGIPKLWRRWPVDLVAQDFSVVNGPEGPMSQDAGKLSAEELYGAEVSDYTIGAMDRFGLERPLTWRGVLLALEGVARQLGHEDVERKFVRSGGLLGAPDIGDEDPMQEIERRNREYLASGDKPGGLGHHLAAVSQDMLTRPAREPAEGWIARAFGQVERERARLEQVRDTLREQLDRVDPEDARQRALVQRRLDEQEKLVRRTDGTREYLEKLLSPFPGPDGERRFTEEIKAVGEAHLDWARRKAADIGRALENVRSRDLDAFISDADWAGFSDVLADDRSEYWKRALNTRQIMKAEQRLSVSRYVTMAIREDLLDLYTLDPDALSYIPEDHREDFLQKLRHGYKGRRHQMGGFPEAVQEGPDRSETLLFQFASDRAMGWMFGDMGALYLTISPDDLRKGRFDRVQDLLEGH